MKSITEHKIIFGDSRSLNLIDNESVQLIITSPPYWQLKDYGAVGQIGFDDTYEEYINNLNLVWNECYRVLSPGCKMCINIGDQFARSVYYGRYKIIPIRTEIIRFCESIGMDYMGAIIWQKATTMNTTGGGAVMGSFPYPRNGILKMDYEFILLFKKQGTAPKPTKEQKEKSQLSKEEWNQYFSSHWNFNGVKQLEHIAMFPEELPKRLIKMFSFIGEMVFDPFIGSGTTSLVAEKEGRNSIGYELNINFEPSIRKKIMTNNNVKVDFIIDDNPIIPKYDVLPYVFKDPLKINKKVDIKNFKFGSRIDGSREVRNKLFGVKRVISPETIELSNGLIIRLLGVKRNATYDKEAMNYLQAKLNKRKVFLRYDSVKYDASDVLLCYLYLDNKTFINAHLIRTGFVDVDDTIDYAYKLKFMESRKNG